MDKNVNTKVENQKNEHAAAVDAEKDKKFKEQKAAAAKKFKEKKAAEKLDNQDAAKKVIDLLQKEKKWDALEEKTKATLTRLANPAAGSSSSGSSFFNKVFGDNPKVGDKIKLIDYLKNTMRAKADLDKYVKEWAKKGTIVEFKQEANMLESTYTIKAIQ